MHVWTWPSAARQPARSFARPLAPPCVVARENPGFDRVAWATLGVSLRLSSTLYSVSVMTTTPDDQVPHCCASSVVRVRSDLLLRARARQILAVRAKGSHFACAERCVA
jgi:hypothetical protein